MMLRSLTLKTIRDRRVSLVWWMVALVALVLSITSIFPGIQESAKELIEYAESLPDAVKAFAGSEDITDIATPTGFLNAELFGLMVPIMFVIFAVGFGSSAIAGEEEQGTLDILLANPVPRWRLVIEKSMAMIAATSLLGLVMWISLVVGTRVFGMDVPAAKLAAASVTSVLLALSFGAVAMAVGCLTGRRSLAIAVATVLAAGSYILNVITKLVESTKGYEKLSLFYYHIDVSPLRYGINFSDVAPLIAVTLAALAVGMIGFARRDLA